MSQKTVLNKNELSEEELLKKLQNTSGLHLKKGIIYLQFKIPNKATQVRRSTGYPLTEVNLEIAQRKLANIKIDIENQLFKNDEQSFWATHFPTHASLSCKTKLAECIREYRDEQKNRISDSFSSKLRTVENWLGREHLLERFIAEITTEDLEKIRDKKVVSCRASTVSDYTFTLNRIFKYALTRGYIKKNPIKDLTPLEADDYYDSDQYIAQPFSSEELKRIFSVVHIPQTKRILKLAALTGLRHGELFALAWEDIDFEKGVLNVRRSLTREGNLKPPKTQAGVRKVYLVPEALKVLKKQKKKTFGLAPVLETINFKNQKKRQEYKRRVFLSRGNVPYKRPEISSTPKQWENWLKLAKVDHRPAYQLRHTYAANMLKNGADLNFLAKQMGHTDWSVITRIYGRVIKDDETSHFAEIVTNMMK